MVKITSEDGGNYPAAGQLRPGLTLIATPIGNAADITLRALAALREADMIVAEDTRMARRLMDLHGIALAQRPLAPWHDHSSDAERERIRQALAEGLRVIYLTDAGTPLISDPGFRLVDMAHKNGISVSSTPGPSAAIMALSLSGLPADRFFFAGFLPPKTQARQKALKHLAGIEATLIFYESPKRLAAALADMTAVFGSRQAVIARELTKHFEELHRGELAALAAHYAAHTPKGEIVLLLGPPEETTPDPQQIEAALGDALAQMSLKDAAASIAERFGLSRKEVYAQALALKAGEND